MNRGFYPRLAWTGMKQNRRLYLPYLLTCTGVTAVFYILMGLSVSSVLRLPLHPQAPAAVQPQQHLAAHRHHRRLLRGLRPAVYAGL